MLEIDGEFFEDPCENIKTGKAIAAISVLEMAVTQIALIMAQPLFPGRAQGGIVNPNILKGDIVHPSLWDMDNTGDIAYVK